MIGRGMSENTSQTLHHVAEMHEYENELTQYAYNQMIKNNDIKIYGDFINQTSIISFNIDGIHFKPQQRHRSIRR